eukprot:scaffold5899_cov167-Amphora_coffeaeformis.AAC.4
MEVISEAVTLEVTNYLIDDFEVSRRNFEGRATASGSPVAETAFSNADANVYPVGILLEPPPTTGTPTLSLTRPPTPEPTPPLQSQNYDYYHSTKKQKHKMKMR